jgi:hypothetical protein
LVPQPLRTAPGKRWNPTAVGRGDSGYRRAQVCRASTAGKRIQATSNHRNGASLPLVDGPRRRANPYQSAHFGLQRHAIGGFSASWLGGVPASGRLSRNCKGLLSRNSDRNFVPGCAPPASGGERRISLAPYSWRAAARPRGADRPVVRLVC